MPTIADLRELVSQTYTEPAEAMTRELLALGVDPMEILEEGVMTGLNDVGNRFAAKQAIVKSESMRSGVSRRLRRGSMPARDETRKLASQSVTARATSVGRGRRRPPGTSGRAAPTRSSATVRRKRTFGVTYG